MVRLINLIAELSKSVITIQIAKEKPFKHIAQREQFVVIKNVINAVIFEACIVFVGEL